MLQLLIGFAIAVLIALTGVGAGVVTAPLLILFLHVPVEIAVSTALAYAAVVKLIVVPVQIWRKQVSYRILVWMLVGGIPGVILGSLIFGHVAHHGPKALLHLVRQVSEIRRKYRGCQFDQNRVQEVGSKSAEILARPAAAHPSQGQPVW